MNFLSLFKRNIIFKFKNKINIDNDTFKENISLDELCSFYKTDKAKYIKPTNKFMSKVPFYEMNKVIVDETQRPFPLGN